jgi:glycosyltransferase involved in cell wall biosynthesis
VKISAYIPCYNNADTLADAIASVRAQGDRIDQLCVVDDASSDDSVAVARRCGVELIVNSANRGRGAVRATALKALRNEWVLSCDAGLQLDADFLANACGWLSQNEVAATFGRVQQRQPRNATDRWRQRHLFKGDVLPAVNRQASLATGGALLRRSVVLAVGNFKASLRSGEDAELGHRLTAAGHEVVFDPKLVTYCQHSNSLRELLERYRRWNISGPLDWKSYLRHVSYSIRVMLCHDLRRNDLTAAAISLFCPHYLFWVKETSGPTRLDKTDER